MKNNLFWTGFFALVSVFRERKLLIAEKKELAVTEEKVVEIEMERLRSFENHPFKVKADSQMIELQESVKKYGILNPLIVRPRKDGTYEIISGHRRKFAAEKIGYQKVPVIIRVLKDDDAVVSMVDSNLQREMISPSEKAFAYKMKYEVIKRRAGRRKCGQVDHNLGKKSIDLIEDTQLAEIARAEACYFTADAKGCVEHIKKYLAAVCICKPDTRKCRKGTGSAHRCKAVSAKSTGRISESTRGRTDCNADGRCGLSDPIYLFKLYCGHVPDQSKRAEGSDRFREESNFFCGKRRTF